MGRRNRGRPRTRWRDLNTGLGTLVTVAQERESLEPPARAAAPRPGPRKAVLKFKMRMRT